MKIRFRSKLSRTKVLFARALGMSLSVWKYRRRRRRSDRVLWSVPSVLVVTSSRPIVRCRVLAWRVILLACSVSRWREFFVPRSRLTRRKNFDPIMTSCNRKVGDSLRYPKGLAKSRLVYPKSRAIVVSLAKLMRKKLRGRRVRSRRKWTRITRRLRILLIRRRRRLRVSRRRKALSLFRRRPRLLMSSRRSLRAVRLLARLMLTVCFVLLLRVVRKVWAKLFILLSRLSHRNLRAIASRRRFAMRIVSW